MSADAVGRAMPAQVGLNDLAAMNAGDMYGHRYEISPEGMLSWVPGGRATRTRLLFRR
jgi:hypothetical protein